LEQKTGHKLDANTNEKITDGARGVYEKATGYAFLIIRIRIKRG